MKTARDKLFAKFEDCLTLSFPEISQPKLRKCGNALVDIAYTEQSESIKVFSDLYRDISLKTEQHKLLFRQHIELISKHSNILMDELHKNQLVVVKTDKSSGKRQLVGRSIFANSLVKFLTEMDESVRKFYVDVYEIKDEKQAKETGFQQTSLF